MSLQNRDQFRKLFEKHFKSLRNYVYYRCGDAELATDIAQDTFVRVWEKGIELYDGKEMGLLVKIANDLFVSAHRRMKVGQRFQNSINMGIESFTPDEQMSFNEMQAKYEKALAEMNETQRVVFLMSRQEGLKYAEIAERLGIGQKAVEKRMSNALDYFREKLL